MTILLRASALLALSAACLATSVSAQVWRSIDAEGVWHFSNERASATDELILAPQELADTLTRATVAPTSALMERTAQRIQSSPAYGAVRPLVEEAANQYGVEHELLTAVVAAESAFDAKAVSPKGAVGLMQVMPATARRFGVSPAPGHPVERQLRDPRVNVQTGTRYLAYLLKLFEGELELAVAAYNAGEGAVMRAGGQVPNYRETRQYVAKVLSLYSALRAGG